MVKAVAEFLKAAARLAQSGVRKEGIENFAREEFGEISEFLQAQINNIFRKKERGILNVEKRQPIGQDGNVIEAVFKPGMDKKGKITQESPSQKGITTLRGDETFDELLEMEKQSPLMKRLEGKAEGLRKGVNLSTGLTRTLAREMLMDKGIKISKGTDPIELLNRQYGPDVLSQVSDLADELIEMERRGEAYKDIKTILKQEGLLDIKTPGQIRTGYTPEELEEIQKAIEEEDMLLKFDPTDREPNATGGIAGIKGLLKLLNKKFGKDTLKTTDKIEKPKSTKEKEMFKDFEKRINKEKQIEKFREGPITAKFLDEVDQDVINPFVSTRDAGGKGGYGLYKSFDEMPAGLKAAELINRVKTRDGSIDYESAEFFIGKKLKGNESIDELIEMIVTPQRIEKAGGGLSYLMGL